MDFDLFSLRRTPLRLTVDGAPDVVLARLRAAADRNGPFDVKRSGPDRVRVRPRTNDLVPVFTGHVRREGDGSVLVGTIGPDALMTAWRAICIALILGGLVLVFLTTGPLAAVVTAIVVILVVPALIRLRSNLWLAQRARHPTRADMFAADLSAIASGHR